MLASALRPGESTLWLFVFGSSDQDKSLELKDPAATIQPGAAGARWRKQPWDGEMPHDLIRLSDAARKEIRIKQQIALNPPPVDASRKVLRVTAINRKKPRVITSTAAQHANVTSLALVFRMLGVRELTRVSQACQLWQSAALNPLAYLCTYNTSTANARKLDGPQLTVVAPSDAMLRSRIVHQYRAIALAELSPLYPGVLSSLQQMQLLTLTLSGGLEEDTIFRTLPPSLRLLSITTNYSSPDLLPADFAQQIAHLHQLADLVLVKSGGNHLSSRDLHQLRLVSDTIPSLRRLLLQVPIEYEAFDQFRNDSSSDVLTQLPYAELPSVQDPRQLLSVLDLMPNLVALQLIGTDSHLWPQEVSELPQWPHATRVGIKEFTITEIDQPNSVCLLVASAKLGELRTLSFTSSSQSHLRANLGPDALTMLCESLPLVERLRLEVGPMEVTTLDMFAAMPRLTSLVGITWPRAISRGNLAKAFPALTHLHVAADNFFQLMPPHEALASIPKLESVRWIAQTLLARELRFRVFMDSIDRPKAKRTVYDQCTQAMDDRKLAAIQAFYICYTCSTEDGPKSLVCEGCAATCHIGHTIGPKEMPHNTTFVCACSVLGDEHQTCKLGVVGSSSSAPTLAETKNARYAEMCAIAAEREQQRLQQEQAEALKLAESKTVATVEISASARYAAIALELTSPTYVAYPPIADDAITTCTISPPPIDVLSTQLLARVFSCLNLPELVCVNRASSGWQRALADPLAIASDLEHSSIDRSKDEDGRPHQLARLTLDRVYGLHLHAPVFVVTSARQLDLGLASSSSPRSLFSRIHHLVLQPTVDAQSDTALAAMLTTSRRLEHPIYSLQIGTPTVTPSAWESSFDRSAAVWSRLRFFHVHSSTSCMQTIFERVPLGVEHWQYTIAAPDYRRDPCFWDNSRSSFTFPLGLAALLGPLTFLRTVCVRTKSCMVLPPTCWTPSTVDLDKMFRAFDFLGELASLVPQIEQTHWLVPTHVEDVADHAYRHGRPTANSEAAIVLPSRVRALHLDAWDFKPFAIDIVFPELESLTVWSCLEKPSIPKAVTQAVTQLAQLRRLEVQQAVSSFLQRLMRVLANTPLGRLERLVLCDPDPNSRQRLQGPASLELQAMFEAMPQLTHLTMVNIRCSDLTTFAHLPRLRVLEHFGWPLLHASESELGLAALFPSLERLHVEFGSTADPPADIADAIQRLPKLRAVKWMANKEVSPSLLSVETSGPESDFSIHAAFTSLVLGARENASSSASSSSFSTPFVPFSFPAAIPTSSPFALLLSSGVPSFAFAPSSSVTVTTAGFKGKASSRSSRGNH